MRKIREVLRLSFENGCSQREIAAATRISKGSVGDTLNRAKAAGLSWELAGTGLDSDRDIVSVQVGELVTLKDHV